MSDPHRQGPASADRRRFGTALLGAPLLGSPLLGAALRSLPAAAALGSLAAPAGAQSAGFPNRPIRCIVPFTPGSGSDSGARFFGERLSVLLGQPVVAENKPGAGGVLALQQVKQMPADGYTLFLASISPMTVNPVVYKTLPYDPLKDLRPVAGMTRGMNVVITSNDSKLRSFADLLARGRSGGAPMNVGTYSAGYQLAAAWFANLGGFRVTNVPYKGQAPIVTDIIGNQLDFAMVDLGGAVPLIKGGQLRALAVSGEQRNPDFPDVPTIREHGFPEYAQYSWVSFFVRAETPDDITARLADAMQKVLNSPEAADYARKQGAELMPYGPERMSRYLREEIERFKRVAAAAGIQPAESL